MRISDWSSDVCSADLSGSLGGPRSPRQVGCEIFGEAGVAADLEVLRVMLKTLKLAGMKKVHLDLGHVGIYRAVIAKLKLDAGNEAALRSEEHTSELQSLMRISYAVFCLKKKNDTNKSNNKHNR